MFNNTKVVNNFHLWFILIYEQNKHMNNPRDDHHHEFGGGVAMIRKMKRFLFAVEENRVQDVEIVKND